MNRRPLLRFHLPVALKDTRRLDEQARYDLLSATIPEFIFSQNNPLLWQNELRYPYFRKYMGEVSGKLVLDVGCGWGFLASKFAADGANVVGLDISFVTLQAMKDRCRPHFPAIGLVRGAGERLPCSCSFDAVTCTDVLEHVEDLETVIAEVSRVLKPGGWFGFVTVNKTALAHFVYLALAESLMRVVPRGTHRFGKFIRPRDLLALMRKHGMELVDLQGILVDPILRKYHFWPSKAIEYVGVARRR